MTLELGQLSEQVRAMGQAVASREQTTPDLLIPARQWLVDHADEGASRRQVARRAQTASPTDEPLDAVRPLPAALKRFTGAAADGSQIQPDRHDSALYHLITIGSLLHRHGSREASQATSESRLGHTEDDLYENGMPLAGHLFGAGGELVRLLATDPNHLEGLLDEDHSLGDRAGI